jgi:hypothetical protein
LQAREGRAQLTADTAEAVEALFQRPREEFKRLKSGTNYLEVIARDGPRRVREVSEAAVTLVRAQIGLART